MSGRVIGIYIAPRAEAPMQSVAEARLEPGRGIVGDRYHSAIGTFSEKLKNRADSEVTLVESEQIGQFRQSTGLTLDYGDLRRNIVTEQIDLNALVGMTFQVGAVTLEGLRLCEPCSHLARLVAREVLPGMVHRAGLRARIVAGGTIRLADAVAASG